MTVFESGPASEGTRTILSFGSFQLCPDQRWIEKAGRRIEIGSRMFEMLTVLAERAGETVTKRELLARVWPDLIVDEVSLRVQIAGLRKALGDGKDGNRFIANISGQGYCFVAPVAKQTVVSPSREDTGRADRSNLPMRLSRVIGRDNETTVISQQLLSHRLVTIVGPGGIGKTTVAVAVASSLMNEFGQAIKFINFSALNDPALVITTVASAFGVTTGSDDPAQYIVSHLLTKRVLLVFDCCEHLIEATAALAERLVTEAPDVFLLATSRESLRVTGEHVYRLFPLDIPPPAGEVTAAAALDHPVVQLLVERAAAGASHFVFDDSVAATAIEICRRLDGIPLAIELAAARIGVFGVTATADGLADLFALLTNGRRTALPRHQTLRATLDWSHQLLSPKEQVVMRRLSVFRGSFVLQTAVAVAAFGVISPLEAQQAIGDLVAKSLLTSSNGAHAMRFRFLDTTRAYAAEELAKSDELGEVRRRHAELCAQAFENAEDDWETLSQPQWFEKYGLMIDDARAAQEWAFQPHGDPATGVAIMAQSAPLWFASGLMEEYCGRAELALRHIEQSGLEGSEFEMKLRLAVGVATFNARGARPAMASAAARALEIAEALGATTYQMRALWQIARERSTKGDYRDALFYCERFDALARLGTDMRMWVVGDRMMALGLFFVGRLRDARVVAERAVDDPAAFVRSAHMSFNEYDHRVASRSHLARILAVSGQAGEAARYAAEGVEHGLRLGYAPTACYILTFAAIPAALWSGDIEAASRYLEQLSQQAAGLPNGYWHQWLRVFERIMALHEMSEPNLRARQISAILSEASSPFLSDAIATFSDELVNDLALTRALSGESGWSAPEVIRADGMRLLRAKRNDEAEARFRQSLALAEQNGSLAWQLRAALSLARLCSADGRETEALALVRATTEQFPPDAVTADLQAARDFLGRPKPRLRVCN